MSPTSHSTSLHGEAVRPAFRLVVRDLADEDLARVAGALRALSTPGRPQWTLAFGGEADLVVAGDTAAGGAGSAPQVRVSEPARPGRPEVLLRRPVDPQAVAALLAAYTRRQAATPATAASAPAPAAVRATVPTIVPSAWPRDARFRLRRWPPGALLQPVYRRQLADHLMMRDVDMVSLARACRVPLLRCCEYVSALQAAGLLLVDGQPAPAAPPAVPC